jgi:hypothetical protein
MLAFPQTSRTSRNPDPVYAPLWLYDGKWQVTRANAPAGSKPDLLQNECSRMGKFFACQQSVNGAPSQLLVFVPLGEAGKYATQTVMPEGRAGGRGELQIEDDRWTFSGSWNNGSRTIYTRTVNVFTGKNKIHFEQSESTNRRDWEVKGSGDDVRVR